ncbi:transcription repressor OFP1-like, partial [Lolium rigidum]|uniref:transcription repressor OFP1-like n=1 Tax=Lolium rigidum TaxID=89674 RepID=UPI001F5CF4F4
SSACSSASSSSSLSSSHSSSLDGGGESSLLDDAARSRRIKRKKTARSARASRASRLSKLTAKSNVAASSRPKAKSVAGGFLSCFHERPTPSSASQSSPTDASSPAAAASDIAPRRLSVGNDDAEAAAAVARQLYRRRHYSVGGDRDLPPLRHLTLFSRSSSPPVRAPATPRTTGSTPMPSSPPSDTDDEKRPRSRQRRCRGSRRRSFTGGTPRARLAAVRVRSPRCAAAAVSGLERFAVVRRTSDPQREFRDSMVEMIASRRIGRPEELETLLACYLSLNADEHHDCIVKVFRQVWFDLKLNPARVAAAAAAAGRL